MATHLQHLLLLFLLTITHFSSAQTTLSHGSFLLDITKDSETLQYTTQLLIGTPQLPTKLVVHLSGESLWLTCPPSSSSRHLIHHRSLPCLMAKSGSNTPTTTICNIHQQNPVTGASSFGDLAEDIITNDGLTPLVKANTFLFSCSPEYLLNGLVTSAKGIIGFGRSKIAYQSQIFNNLYSPRKFTVCLSSSNGFIFSGTSLSNSLSYTPLISTHGSKGYFVNVNSIKINNRKVALQSIGGVEISSIIPYTTMESKIYETFTKAYLFAATSLNMTRVSPVKPFGICFESETRVPEIELVLQSELVKWKIQRRNSMVQVSDSVMCLGVVDGGLDLNHSVVLGSYQLEDHIMEFNLGTGMMGFSSSLLNEGNSCANIRESVSTQKESL